MFLFDPMLGGYKTILTPVLYILFLIICIVFIVLLSKIKVDKKVKTKKETTKHKKIKPSKEKSSKPINFPYRTVGVFILLFTILFVAFILYSAYYIDKFDCNKRHLPMIINSATDISRPAFCETAKMMSDNNPLFMFVLFVGLTGGIILFSIPYMQKKMKSKEDAKKHLLGALYAYLLATIFFFIPFAPAIAGFIVWYKKGGGFKSGARIGGGMLSLTVLFGYLLVFFIMAVIPDSFEFLDGGALILLPIVMVIGFYNMIFGTIGAGIAGSLETDKK